MTVTKSLSNECMPVWIHQVNFAILYTAGTGRVGWYKAVPEFVGAVALCHHLFISSMIFINLLSCAGVNKPL